MINFLSTDVLNRLEHQLFLASTWSIVSLPTHFQATWLSLILDLRQRP